MAIALPPPHPGSSRPRKAGAPDSRIGRVLQNRYLVVARVAEGGMATVYRGTRLTLDKPVAIKFLRAAMATEPRIRRRFEVEASAMSRLAHPNCVSVIDFGVDGQPYLVMDLIEGVPLRARIDAGALPVDLALRIAGQTLAALEHAHAQRIIHRDIKPENIVLAQTPGLQGHVRILDFGIAKLIGNDLGLTIGMALGTPKYMAPEQTRVGGTVDERVDLYATAIVLTEMLTGVNPFDAPSISEVFLRQLSMAPPPLREMAPAAGFSAELEALLLRAMAKAPAERFPSAAAMAAALEAVPEMSGTGRSRSNPAPGAKVQADATIVESLPAFLRADAEAPPNPALASAAPLAARRIADARRLASLGRARLAATAVRCTARVRTLALWVAASRRGTIAAGVAGLSLVAALSAAVMLSRSVSVPSAPGVANVGRATALPSPRASVGTTPTARQRKAVPVRNESDREIDRLLQLRRAEPRNADHAASLARLYFEKQWWSAGVGAFQAAIRIDPARKADPVLVGYVITSLRSERFGDTADAFLRELGPAAKPHLQEAARSHPSPRVRAHAAELLRSVDRRPLWRRWR